MGGFNGTDVILTGTSMLRFVRGSWLLMTSRTEDQTGAETPSTAATREERTTCVVETVVYGDHVGQRGQ